MDWVTDKQVVVLGLGRSGQAACKLLQRSRARVIALDEADNEALRQAAAALDRLGVDVRLGCRELPAERFDLAVTSPGIRPISPLIRALRERNVPIISELELGYRHSLCLTLAVTGTNGKTTTVELIEKVLRHHQFRTLAAGNIGRPICEVTDQTRELDFLTLEVSSFQLEGIQFFRPVVAVLLNIAPDHLDRYASMADYLRAKARIFMNQQAFDWAIVQSEALAQLRALDVRIPSKIITFSASNRRADLWMDRGLLISRLPDWSGPLLDLDTCALRGPHHAENILATLAVGRVLRIPLAVMVEAIRQYRPAPHRCEPITEINGVHYVNDSKATNLDALHKALLSLPSAPGGEPNVWLIAGGQDKGLEYHDIGPLLSQRVKGAFLIGEAREKLRAAWSLFTPCTLMPSLVEAVKAAARKAQPGDVVLLSPACASFDQFKNYQERGETFRRTVMELAGQSPTASSADPSHSAG